MNIHEGIEGSQYKPWQVYLLIASVVSGLGLYLRIEIVVLSLQTIERALAGWDWLLILGIQGVLIGFVAEFLYEQGDRYAKSASHRFGSKDRTLFFRIGVMTLVSGAITRVVPSALHQATEFLALQTAGATIVLGIVLIHTTTSNWNPWTEWPAVLAGIVLAIIPSVV